MISHTQVYWGEGGGGGVSQCNVCGEMNIYYLYIVLHTNRELKGGQQISRLPGIAVLSRHAWCLRVLRTANTYSSLV